MNTRFRTKQMPSSGIVHQNMIGHSVFDAMKHPIVGGAIGPRRKERENTEKALPRSCTKKRSIRIRGPRVDGTVAPNPAKNRDARNELYWDLSVMEAPQMLQTKTKKVVQKIVEVRPTACDKGSSANGPIIIPAMAIEV